MVYAFYYIISYLYPACILLPFSRRRSKSSYASRDRRSQVVSIRKSGAVRQTRASPSRSQRTLMGRSAGDRLFHSVRTFVLDELGRKMEVVLVRKSLVMEKRDESSMRLLQDEVLLANATRLAGHACTNCTRVNVTPLGQQLGWLIDIYFRSRMKRHTRARYLTLRGYGTIKTSGIRKYVQTRRKCGTSIRINRQFYIQPERN